MDKTQVRVHYISPYSTEKNIGKAINEAIITLCANSDDWVVLTDYDVLWLLPESKGQVEGILSTTDYDLLGCVTNRLAQTCQLQKGAFDVYDIRQHIQFAKDRHDTFGATVTPYNNILAAFMLCFRISTWHKLGGFREASLQFDSLFSIKAKRMGMKLALMQGVYVYHLYRTGHSQPARYIEHLKPHSHPEL